MQYYLLDENLSRRLVDKLSLVFAKVSHVIYENLQNRADADIWYFAKERQIIIITKDNDFYEMSNFYGCPPKVVKLNCGNKTTDFICNLILSNAELLKEFAAGDKCYLDIY